MELVSLQVAALGIGDLRRRCPPPVCTLEDVAEIEDAVFHHQPVAALTARLQRKAVILLAAGGIGDEFVGNAEFGHPFGRRGIAETEIDLDPVLNLRGNHAARADIENMLAGLQTGSIDHRHRAVGAAGDDIGAFVDIARLVADHDLDAVLFADFLRERLAIGSGGAEHLQPADIPDAHEGVDMAARHAAGAEHPDDMGVFPAHIFDADAAIRANPHMLQDPVIDKGQWLPVFGIGQQDQAAVEAGFLAIFFLTADAVVLGLVNHVRFHADGEIAADHAALHRAPLIGLLRIGRRQTASPSARAR